MLTPWLKKSLRHFSAWRFSLLLFCASVGLLFIPCLSAEAATIVEPLVSTATSTSPVHFNVTGVDNWNAYPGHELCLAVSNEPGYIDYYCDSGFETGATHDIVCDISMPVGYNFHAITAYASDDACANQWDGAQLSGAYDLTIVEGGEVTPPTSTTSSTTIDVTTLYRTEQLILVGLTVIIFLMAGWLGFRLVRK